MIQWLRRYISLSLLAVLAFVAYVLFFNENSVMQSIDYSSQIREKKAQIAMYEDTLRYYTELNRKLDTDPAELVRIMRVNYGYQRPSEDVYIINP